MIAANLAMTVPLTLRTVRMASPSAAFSLRVMLFRAGWAQARLLAN